MELSKTMQAMKLIEGGMKVHDACRQVGVSEQAVYSARKRQEGSVARGKIRCPCCNSMVPRDRINQEVLK